MAGRASILLFMDERKLIDISRTLSPTIAVWPGDSNFTIDQIMDMKQGEPVNLTTITMSAHTGTHADAPRHFDDAGQSMSEVNLSPYWGLCQVVTTIREKGPIEIEDFTQYDLSLAPRLLVRTPAGDVSHDLFPAIIPYPSTQLVDYLGSVDICLYGTDALSMDDVESQSLPGHNALLRNNIAILEGLDLRQAPDGLYELSALPLKIAGGDGSPVRAVLRQIK